METRPFRYPKQPQSSNCERLFPWLINDRFWPRLAKADLKLLAVNQSSKAGW